MKNLLLTLVFLGRVPAAFTQPIPPFADTLEVGVEEGLRLALDQQVDPWEATHLILRAAYRGGPENRGTLQAIVAGAEAGRVPVSYAELALEALWEIGESPDYFFRLARRWNRGRVTELPLYERQDELHYRLAFFAANILARDPTLEVLAALDSVSIATGRDGQLGTAYSRARNAASYIRTYEQITSPNERVAFALRFAARSWSSMPGGLFSTNSHLAPMAAVGRRWLEELARQHPQIVAQAIWNLSREGVDDDSSFLDYQQSFVDYLAAFTSPEVRAILTTAPSDR